MKKLAFCFLIYDKINHKELWNSFFKNIDKSKYNIYIHYKNNIPLEFFEEFKIQNCIETKWADISLVKAQNILLNEALKDIDNQHFIFISNSCIPLKNFKYIYDNLNENYSYFNICNKHSCFPRCADVSNYIDIKYIQKAHQWCILNRKHSLLMVTKTEHIQWFENIFAPNEHCYITNIFANHLENEIITTNNLSNDATTFTNWGGMGYKYESSYGLKNYNSISDEELSYLLDSKCLFGRKFNEECILNNIDYSDSICLKTVSLLYTSLNFGESIENNWGIINIYDKDNKPTNLIGVRGPIFNTTKLDELLQTKKLIGISSYQNFPQPIKNIYDDPNYKDNSNIFIQKYESKIILWCHCFKDPQNYIPPGIPLLLYSETDIYNGNTLINLADTVEKKYDFFCSLPDREWNDWIRGAEVAKKWLNYMADTMGLKILIGGGDKKHGFSDKIIFLGQLQWNKFIENMNSSKYFINFARYDASPRVIIEALCLNIPVLLNHDILGGWKYINKSTGNLFFYDEPIEKCINTFINTNFSPLNWMKHNFNIENNKIKLANTINKLISYKYEDLLDGIMYINLTERVDRYTSILNEFKKVEIPKNLIHRIDAVLNRVCGYLGTVDSHIIALEYAKQMKWKKFLILEDDAIFNYPKERILYIISEFYKKFENNWDVFMLSTYWTEMIDTDTNFIKKLVYGTTFTSYIVNDHYIDTLLTNFKEGRKLLYDEVEEWKITNPKEKKYTSNYALDQYNNIIQRRDKWYISVPYLCIQSPNLYSSTLQHATL